MAQKLGASRRVLPTVAGITMGFPASTPGDEEPFWRILEREYGILIEQVPWEHGNLRRAEAFVWHTELPQHHPLWNWQQSILETNRQREIRLVLTGFFGDQVLSANAYLIDLFRSLRWGKLLHHLRSSSRSMGVGMPWIVGHFLSNLLKSSIHGAVFPVARGLKLRIGPRRYPIWYSKSFRDRGLTRGRGADFECSSKHAEEQYQQLRSVDFLLRIEQTNKMYAMYGLDTATPFLDPDLLAFLMSVPGDVVNCGGISKGLYRRSMSGVLPHSIRERTSKGDSTFFVNETTQQEYAAIKNYFSGDCLSIQLGYVDPDVVQRQFTKLEHSFPLPEDSAIASWDLAYLFGLELWLRVFFGSKTILTPAAPEPTVLRTHLPMHNQISAAQ